MVDARNGRISVRIRALTEGCIREFFYVAEGRELHAEYFAAEAGAPLLIDIHGGGFCFGRAAETQLACFEAAVGEIVTFLKIK